MLAIWLLLVFGPILVWAVFRGRGYKRVPLDRPPSGPGWQRTAERFHDPRSGELLEAWFEPRTGERTYVRVAPLGRPD